MSGLQIVLLCAAGIGQYAVANIKNNNRLRLPTEIKNQEQALQKPFLKKLVETYSVNGLNAALFTFISDSDQYPWTHHCVYLIRPRASLRHLGPRSRADKFTNSH